MVALPQQSATTVRAGQLNEAARWRTPCGQSVNAASGRGDKPGTTRLWRVAPGLSPLIHPLPTLRRAIPATGCERLRRNNKQILTRRKMGPGCHSSYTRRNRGSIAPGLTESRQQLFTTLAGDCLRYSPTKRANWPPSTPGSSAPSLAGSSGAWCLILSESAPATSAPCGIPAGAPVASP